MKTISIYDYEDPIDFLNQIYLNFKTKNSLFSLRAWSKQIGFEHVAHLSMILNRKRALLPKTALKFTAYFESKMNFSASEVKYFQTLVYLYISKTEDEQLFYKKVIEELKPSKSFSEITLDQLAIISEWYHSAIIEMTNLNDFKNDPEWICTKLNHLVAEDIIKIAIERLVRLGFLKKVDSDKGLEKTNAFFATPSDISSEVLKRYHNEMILKAKDALYSQSVDERDMTSYTFCMNKNQIPQAKKMILEFRRKFASLLDVQNGDSVFQMNIQLFNLLCD